MEFKDLDAMFNASLERLEQGKSPEPGAYPGGPLAADHFLLNKSWVYFRSRIRSIEDHWRQLLSAKDAESKALRKQLQGLKQHVSQMERENKDVRKFDEELKLLRARDFSGFKEDNHRLKEAWEEERGVLDRDIHSLQFQLSQTKKELEKYRDLEKRTRLEWQTRIDSIKNDNERLLQKEAQIREDLRKDVAQKEEHLQSLDLKIDLLKKEVARRDQIIGTTSEEVELQKRKQYTAEDQAAKLRANLSELQSNLDHARLELEIVRKEKESLRTSWAREQAEWRELWDRERETWEKQQNHIKRLEEQSRKRSE